MARVPYVRTEDIPPGYPEIAARNINIYRTLAHNLDCAQAFSTFGKYIRYSSKLDPRLRELTVLQVGFVSNCAYEFYHHVKIGRQFGVSDADIDAMIAETAGTDSDLGEVEKAALRLARQLTREAIVDDDTYAAIARLLPTDHLIDLVATVCHYNSAVRFLKCFEVDLEPGYEAAVERFPLPGGR